jgi:hypothetical protein
MCYLPLRDRTIPAGGSQTVQQGQVNLLYIVHRWAPLNVGSTHEGNLRSTRSIHSGGKGQWPEHGLKHQTYRTRSTNLPAIASRLGRRRWLKDEDSGPEFRTFYRRATYLGNCSNSSEMLRSQPRFFPMGADVVDAHRCSGDGSQGESCTNELSTPFAIGPVNRQHLLAIHTVVGRTAVRPYNERSCPWHSNSLAPLSRKPRERARR